MTPKEKAGQLYRKFAQKANSWIEGKQCALIAVDEILSLNTESFDELPNPHHRFSKNYWKQVKQEIELL